MLDQMTALAATEGLRYDFGALRHTRTLLAHQALHFAKAHAPGSPAARSRVPAGQRRNCYHQQ